MDTITERYIILPTYPSTQKCDLKQVEKLTSNPNKTMTLLFDRVVSANKCDTPFLQQLEEVGHGGANFPVLPLTEESDEFKISIPKRLLSYNIEGYISENEEEVEALNKKAAACIKRYRKYIEFEPADKKTELSGEAVKEKVDPKNYGDRRIRADSKMRKDVLYKTLLRSIRRYYIRKFRTENPRFYLKNKIPYKNEVYEKAIRTFCQKYFGGYYKMEDLFYYVTAMIRQEWYLGIKNIPPHIQSSIGQIYSCFYKFKLWQFEKLAKSEHIQKMFDTMLEEGTDNVIKMERSMLVRREVYLNLFKDFKTYAY